MQVTITPRDRRALLLLSLAVVLTLVLRFGVYGVSPAAGGCRRGMNYAAEKTPGAPAPAHAASVPGNRPC